MIRQRLLLAAIVIGSIAACRQAGPEIVSSRRVMMDTFVSLNVYLPAGSDTASARIALGRVWREARTLDSLFSNYSDSSETAARNRVLGHKPHRVSPPMYALLETAARIASLSEGAFDITIEPVVRLWGFGHTPQVPDSLALAGARAKTSFTFLQLNAKDSTIHSDTRGIGLDLGGIAKGAVIDACYRMLRSAGFEDVLVDAGGDLRMHSGRLTVGQRRIWITHPREPGSYFARIQVDSGAVATTGDYERAFEQDGRRYHHVLDPRTGMPGEKAVSATVFAGDAVTADALATAAFILGPVDGIAMIDRLEGVEAMIVEDGGGTLKPHYSAGLAGRVEVLNARDRYSEKN